MVCLAPVPRGTSPNPPTAGDGLGDSGFGRYRRRNSRRGTRCVGTNRVLAYSPSHLVVWPAAYQLCRPDLAPQGAEVRHLTVTVSLEGLDPGGGRSRGSAPRAAPGQERASLPTCVRISCYCAEAERHVGLRVAVCVRRSAVGILEVGLAAFVEGADALDSIGMDGRAPVRLHHDRDGLLDRFALAHPDRLLDGLYRGR